MGVVLIPFIFAGIFHLGVMVGGRAATERTVCVYDIEEGKTEYKENTTFDVDCDRVMQIEKSDGTLPPSKK